MRRFEEDKLPSRLGFTQDISLPPHVSILFRSRPPLPYLSPGHKNYSTNYSWVVGAERPVGKYFNKPEKVGSPPPSPRAIRIIKHHLLTQKLRKEYDPWRDKKATKDAKRTLFVRNLAYSVTEDKLRSKFSYYGKVRSVRIVTDLAGNSRGYGFVEYKHKDDLREAYEDAHGIKLEGRKIKVEFERGRTQKHWFPRRLDGGKGGRKDKDDQAIIEKVIKEFEEGKYDGKLDPGQLLLQAEKEKIKNDEKRFIKEKDKKLNKKCTQLKDKLPQHKRKSLRDISTEVEDSRYHKSSKKHYRRSRPKY